MWKSPENDAFVEELYLAGEQVPSGTYKQIGSNRKIRLADEDVLPASLDGHVACYVRVQYSWAQVTGFRMTEAKAPPSQTPSSAVEP